MPAQTVSPITNGRGHHLPRLRVSPEAAGGTAEDVSLTFGAPNRSPDPNVSILLDIKLQTCVHGKLSSTGGFASLICFALEPAAAIDQTVWPTGSITISLNFERELKQEQDAIEVLKTGEDRSLTAEVSVFLPAVDRISEARSRLLNSSLYVGTGTFRQAGRLMVDGIASP